MIDTILIVEDDPGLQKQLKWALKSEFNVVLADTRNKALRLFEAEQPAVVLHDLGLPPDSRGVSEGKLSIQSMLNMSKSSRIIVMTGQGDERDAAELIASGAHDFLSKPVDIEVLSVIIKRAFYLSELERSNSRNIKALSPDSVLPGIIGCSEKMKTIGEIVQKVAKTSATVFINGESGTGKELIAGAIHQLSERRDQPFVPLNCAAIPENLLESELFGYEKGAFSGADRQTKGKIEQANGGTLFLDEIGDMEYSLQSKILRFLQERKIQRLGGDTEIPVDVRILSATHHVLPDQIKNKQFREDLYYRINEFEISLPPLRNRGEDKVLIAKYLLEKFGTAHGKSQLDFTADALDAINAYRWEGNVRQMSNLINKAVILSSGNTIDSSDLGLAPTSDASDFGIGEDVTTPTLKSVKEAAEYNLIKNALTKYKNNVTLSAKKLGISRQRIYDLIKKHGLD